MKKIKNFIRHNEDIIVTIINSLIAVSIGYFLGKYGS